MALDLQRENLRNARATPFPARAPLRRDDKQQVSIQYISLSVIAGLDPAIHALTLQQRSP
ncbi:hypothetical protein [Roseibium sp.]|uniref:hypothetical protein n=1 Tax=Roseibium sp. TaxID=1936156 RepID=UPI003BA90134